MSGIIVFIIILVAILSTLSKNKKQTGQRKANSQSSAAPQEVYHRAKREARAGKTQYMPNQKTDKTTAARRNKAGEEILDGSDIRRDLDVMAQSHLWDAAGVESDDGAILASAKLNSYEVEMNNETDSRRDLLEPVYDLMVMGPDTSIRGRRDFEAEAQNLLRRLTL